MKAAGRGELVKVGKPEKLLEAECERLYTFSALMTLAQHTDAASAPVQSWFSFPRACLVFVRGNTVTDVRGHSCASIKVKLTHCLFLKVFGKSSLLV